MDEDEDGRKAPKRAFSLADPRRVKSQQGMIDVARLEIRRVSPSSCNGRRIGREYFRCVGLSIRGDRFKAIRSRARRWIECD
jgi:hypothetical protein